MNNLADEVGTCRYCRADVVAHGLCQSCFEWIDEEVESEPYAPEEVESDPYDPYGHGDDYYPDFDG